MDHAALVNAKPAWQSSWIQIIPVSEDVLLALSHFFSIRPDSRSEMTFDAHGMPVASRVTARQ